jgi:glycosyltransferase involved in cell wall biosynthesis
MKRVNLGSGEDYKVGWINVDIVPGYHTDVVADLSTPFPFKDNSIDEMLASDILEHFTKEDGITFLNECHRVLKRGGILTIRTHNVYQIFDQFKDDPEVLLNFLYGNTSETGVFGAHKYGYTETLLRRKLSLLGFHIESIAKEETNFFVVTKKKDIPSKKLSIGIIQQTPDMGVAYTYMLALADSFRGEGNEILFATNLLALITETKKRNIATTRLPFILDVMGNWKGLVKAIALFPRAVFFYSNLLKSWKRRGVDVILMSGFSEKMLVTWLSKFFKIPVVWIEYAPLDVIFKRNFQLPKVLYRLLKSIPKFVVVPTNYTVRALMRQGRVSQAKLIEIPCGVPMTEKKTTISMPELKGKYVIGNVSRLTREKGQDVLIKALPAVLKNIPNAHLLLIGNGPDRSYFESIVSELHLQDHVTFAGYVPEVSPYYDRMDVFVFPTVWELEGFGLVSVEAMLHHVPVIASDLGPVPEIIDDNITGLLVPPHEEKKIAEMILKIHADKKLRELLVKQAFEKAKHTYTIDVVSRRLHDVLYEATLS